MWFCMIGKCLERELLHRSEVNVDGWKQIASEFTVPELFWRMVLEELGYQPRH